MEQTPTPTPIEPNPATTKLTWAQAEQQLLARLGGKSVPREKLEATEQKKSQSTKTVRFVMIPRR